MQTRTETTCGWVEGQARDHHIAFLGIPFAAPPLGERRFAAPEPAEPWSGVREAAKLGAPAMQGTPFAPGTEVEGRESEDCLTLNVYTPGVDTRKRPVLFWIHGGAFTVGSACQPIYDGGPLAELGDAVVVTTNYRLGVFGLLWLGEAAERFGAIPNLAILDQIAALRWVHDNIASFGGDPNNVTIFGESAGASSVSALLIAPKARGLFHRAIAQSPALHQKLLPLEQADKTTSCILKKLGVARTQLERLRRIPAADLIGAQREAEVETLGFRGFFPIRHPDSLPKEPYQAFADPEQPRIPLIVGSNRDEWNLFEVAKIASWQTPLSRAEMLRELGRTLGPSNAARAEGLLDVYARSRRALSLPHDERALLRAMHGDLYFRMAAVRLAEAHVKAKIPVHEYLFTYASPALRGALGACHALDLPFVFGTYRQPAQERFAGTGPAVERLSATMMHAWLSFARSGAPNHLPEWRSYDLAQRPTMLFDAESKVVHDPLGEERAAWEGIV